MVSLRGVVPLILTGSTGLALLAFGVGGLSGMDPQLQRAAKTVELQRAAPQVVPDRATPDTTVPDVSTQDVACPHEHDRAHRRDEI